MKLRLVSVAALAALLSACAAPVTKYELGNYEQSMYDYYKNPADPGATITALAAIIGKAEGAKRPVPPGVYAEYGFLLLQQGKAQEALANFALEKKYWPESAALMDRMSKQAQLKLGNEVKQ